MTVNTERIEMLTAALRSGEFQQGRSMLRNASNDTYCCLGVACEVYRRETGDGEWMRAKEQLNYVKFVPGGATHDQRGAISDVELPKKVYEWYGFDGPCPTFKTTNDKGAEVITSPVVLNDDDKKSFREIADVIEANFTQ